MLLPLLIATQLATIASPYRVIIAETALAQVQQPDRAWPEEQRDCAGLVRFSYRAAFRKLAPERIATGLWTDKEGNRTAFADARTLIDGSFTSLGRDAAAARQVESGDLLAFQQEPGDDGEPVYHLMLAVRTRGASGGKTLVVYHPGSPGAPVRLGPLSDLAQAPIEWRPVPENRAFLGYFRFKEWTHD